MGIINLLTLISETIVSLPINCNPPIKDRKAIRKIRNIRYSSDKCCVADLYYHESEKPLPMILYMHGGWFIAGDKWNRRGVAKWFSQFGYNVLNINYGLPKKYPYPRALYHLVEALNYFYDHAAEYNLDTGRIVVTGESSGAYHAAWLSVLCSNPELQRRLKLYPKTNVHATVLNCGIYDFDTIEKNGSALHLHLPVMRAFTGYKFADLRTKYPYFSTLTPLTFVTKEFPPTLLLYAKRDFLCKEQGEIMGETLGSLGVPYESCSTLDWFHCVAFLWGSKRAKMVNGKIQEFLERFRDGLPLGREQ